jgi:hypothetical protein
MHIQMADPAVVPTPISALEVKDVVVTIILVGWPIG